MISILNKAIEKLFKQQSNEPSGISIELASAVLLVEVMQADGICTESELNFVKYYLIQHFYLDDSQAKQLIEQAQTFCQQATDSYQFTHLLNQHLSITEKMALVSQLWQIAAADDDVAAIEHHIIRKFADLLHLSHSEYIQCKQKLTRAC